MLLNPDCLLGNTGSPQVLVVLKEEVGSHQREKLLYWFEKFKSKNTGEHVKDGHVPCGMADFPGDLLPSGN